MKSATERFIEQHVIKTKTKLRKILLVKIKENVKESWCRLTQFSV